MTKDMPVSQLCFDTPLVLVGGGEIDGPRLRAWGGIYPVIAVDSGADQARAHGVEPVVITGDMDSISSPDAFPQSRILPTPDQDRTDFDKALSLVEAPLILCLGFLGRRFDHALAAINTMARSGKDRMVLIGPHDAMIFRRGDVALELEAETRVSIWPMGEQDFLSSDGLEWPLDGLKLAPGGKIGTSNRVAEGQGAIRITAAADGGGYFVIVPADQAGQLIKAIAPDIDQAPEALP